MNSLYWLPKHPDFGKAIAQEYKNIEDQLFHCRDLVRHNLDFNQIRRIDRRLEKLFTVLKPDCCGLPTVKVAILAASTVDHLLPAIRVAALRRGLIVSFYVAPYQQYRQEILDDSSFLYKFAPDVVILAFNANEVNLRLLLESSVNEVNTALEELLEEWVQLWHIINTKLQAVVLHQTIVIPVERLFGQYDAIVPATPTNWLLKINEALRIKAVEYKTLLLDLEELAAYVGKYEWCNHTLWHHSKQDISPIYAPLYGDRIARILAAIRGLSYKCLVLDLDNTLWGGIIGDDGIGGIQLGQGSSVGEAFQAFQSYVKALKERGIILAVCSKNDESNAIEAFKSHPEMILQMEDIAIFIANWKDKATNIKIIASSLNISLDSIVFFDDNPVERDLVRQFIPTVAVPEVTEDPALYARCLSDTGYFEAVAFSKDDILRTKDYIANSQRNELQKKVYSIDTFLEQLKMEMIVAPIDAISISRATQLINKSNQFNLTTRRYTEVQVKNLTEEINVFCWQLRLKDRFADNGLISVIIAKPSPNSDKTLAIDTWLMSCRVLGRQVELEVLNILAKKAQNLGYCFLQGEYIKSEKNDMVREHYQILGFDLLEKTESESQILRTLWQLDLRNFVEFSTFIKSTLRGKI